MDFTEYTERALAPAFYPNLGNNPIYPALGLCGESGEVAEKIKKVIRDNKGEFGVDERFEICKELGDVLWYVNALAYEMGFTLHDVAQENIAKLESRKDRGVLSGSGDNR